MWTLVAVKILGIGFMGFSLVAIAPFELGYTILGIVLVRSHNRTNKINGWIVVCYELFVCFVGMGKGLSSW